MEEQPAAPLPARHPSPMRRLLAGLDTDAALYFVLLLLVWGLTVPWRGMWQDDTLLLRSARDVQGHGWAALFTPVATPIRRLYSLPFSLALETPQPVWALHLIFGLTWLGQGLAAGWITRLLLPGQQLMRFVAICLTLTATSDYLTNNLTALGYEIAAVTLLLAIGCGLRYLEGGRLGWLALSCAAVASSIWTLEVAFPAVPFVPRLLLFVLAWGVTLAPAALAEWRFLHWTVGYGAVAMQSMPLAARVARAGELWCENFEPWRWAFAHPIWYPKPPTVIPLWAMGLAAGVGALWFAFRARRAAQPQVPPSAGTARVLSLVGGFALMALIANAAYAGIQFAEIHYRTHILSRIWASLALAVAVGWAAFRWPRFRAVFLLVPLGFVGFGIWGGLERQDLWVSTWRLHQKELVSIVTQAPALAPGTSIILRGGPTPDRYIATEAEYLAQSWLILLYDDPAIHAMRLSTERGTGCRAAPEALECWRELKQACFAAGTCPPDRYPYDKLVLMDFDDQEGVYRLLADPRGDWLLDRAGSASTGYRPDRRIVRRPLSPRQRALVLLR